MTRRRRIALWGGTAALSAAIILVGVPGARTNAVTAWMIALRLVRATGFDWSIWSIAAGTTAIVTGLLLRWVRRVEQPAHIVAKYAARGASVASIARATGLAQDAVRDCLRALPTPAYAAPSAGHRRMGGMLFRGRAARPEPPGPDFARLLRESASRTTT
jgi:hypothetical protein